MSAAHIVATNVGCHLAQVGNNSADAASGCFSCCAGHPMPRLGHKAQSIELVVNELLLQCTYMDKDGFGEDTERCHFAYDCKPVPALSTKTACPDGFLDDCCVAPASSTFSAAESTTCSEKTNSE
jgi:hypothetical protein